MKTRFAKLLTPALFLTLATGAWAQSHDHGHDSHDKKAPQTGLNQGKKWESDAPLRKGMDAIRSAVQVNLHQVHEGKLSDAKFEAMGKTIDTEIQGIFANCKLSPEADEVLHGVLEQIMEGSKVMQTAGEKRSAGYMKIVKAVNEYGTLFEHAGWKKISH